MEKRQRFTAEFKREAIRLMRTSGRPAAVVARELGIPRNRLYKWARIQSRRRRRCLRTRSPYQRHPTGPDRMWVADITYVPTQQGWLYLAAVLDI